jgi:hypothetical protein
MPDEARVLAVDGCPDRETRRCAHCRRWRARDEFPRDRSRPGKRGYRCKQCQRIDAYEHYHEGGGRAAKAAYLARPDVKRRRREADVLRRAKREASKVAYRETPRGKLVIGRCHARSRLRRATTDGQRDRLAARVALYDREIARIDAARAGEPRRRTGS